MTTLANRIKPSSGIKRRADLPFPVSPGEGERWADDLRWERWARGGLLQHLCQGSTGARRPQRRPHQHKIAAPPSLQLRRHSPLHVGTSALLL
ncbi:hypothetical protein CEXT_805891 [Caerostris extrusa]|uniref:Uncharacterized protein n=1 Tax=Caerostris extrusa TaxID=172846 RepID=A0AAV4PDZ2_CAEEX|nr:hypothetical protein CEXT_805891 [Caerostris extrusa]